MRLKVRRAAAVRLRRGRRSDLDALVALERAIFDSRLFAGHLISRTSFRRLLLSLKATILVAETGTKVSRQLLAYVLVLYRSNSNFARMYSIGVVSDVRRRGLARMLLAAAERDARARGCATMRLEVRAGDRAAIALYETSGYRHCGRRPGYYRGRVDALRLEKTLGKEPRHRS